MTLDVLDKILVERPTDNILNELRTPIRADMDIIEHLLINADALLTDAKENFKVDLSLVLLKGRELQVCVRDHDRKKQTTARSIRNKL